MCATHRILLSIEGKLWWEVSKKPFFVNLRELSDFGEQLFRKII